MTGYNCANGITYLPKTAEINLRLMNCYASPVNFRGKSNNLTQDTVELSSSAPKKKKLGAGAKIAIGIVSGVAVLLGTMVAVSKLQTNRLTKLYKEKLVPKVFDKKLVFKEASSRDEAVKYAKEVLGVQKVDENMTIEALNYANRGITDVVNKNIGQELFIPRSYVYEKLEKDKTLAYVNQSVRSKRFGELGLNKIYFDDEFLTQSLKEQLGDGKNAQSAIDILFSSSDGAGLKFKLGDKNGADVKRLINKFKQDPKSLSIDEKRFLRLTTNAGFLGNKRASFDYEGLLKAENIKLDISGMTTVEKIKAIDNYLKKRNLIMEVKIDYSKEDNLKTIYHEMGHLQDFAKNLKELDLKGWDFDLKKIFREAGEEIKSGRKFEDRAGVDEIDNRWGGSTYKGFAELLKNDPEKFKKRYPDLYAHLKDKDIHATALKVSSYSTTGIGEFVAEVYAKMIRGEKIPDDVMKLYKKYKGPLPNGYK